MDCKETKLLFSWEQRCPEGKKLQSRIEIKPQRSSADDGALACKVSEGSLRALQRLLELFMWYFGLKISGFWSAGVEEPAVINEKSKPLNWNLCLLGQSILLSGAEKLSGIKNSLVSLRQKILKSMSSESAHRSCGPGVPRLHLMLTAKLCTCVRVSHLALGLKAWRDQEEHLRFGSSQSQEGPLAKVKSCLQLQSQDWRGHGEKLRLSTISQGQSPRREAKRPWVKVKAVEIPACWRHPNNGWLPRTAIVAEWSWHEPMRQAMCAVKGRAREMELLKSSGAQHITVLFTLLDFGFVLFVTVPWFFPQRVRKCVTCFLFTGAHSRLWTFKKTLGFIMRAWTSKVLKILKVYYVLYCHTKMRSWG